MDEPILTDEDFRIWNLWKKTSLMHARTVRHKRKIDMARRYIDDMVCVAPYAYAALSGGKDSTAMILILGEHGVYPRVMSVKDDLDYPGEEEFVRSLCNRVGCDIDILHPPFSLQEWLRDNAQSMRADEDMHGRSAEFSKAAFYDVIDKYRELKGSPGVFLGLRKNESYGRMMNRVMHGSVYRKKSGEWICQPLCDWTGIDVFAYLFSRDAPILDVYRCCRFHESPERIRKSWWLPGSHSRHGGMIWLKSYYPSLFYRLCELMPDAARLA
jgi:3'-phosphoadenosine 5'-phosphosulfate sulfotransferase (PAPS reductase)/FAD synthetase